MRRTDDARSEDPNLNELVDLVKSAFTTREAPVPSDDIVRALARVVKGVLVAENVLVRAGVPVAAQKMVDAYLEGGL